MCKHGDTVKVTVKIPADLSHTGKSYRKRTQIDRCIAPIVSALQTAGIDMRSSCCGHGKGRFWWLPWVKVHGYIDLQNGRRLIIIGEVK